MKYSGPIFFILLVFAIILGGTYHRSEMVRTSIQLVPTPVARPELVESTLLEYNGIHEVRLSQSDHRLQITYNRGRISLDDLNPILVSLGYRAVMTEAMRVRATM